MAAGPDPDHFFQHMPKLRPTISSCNQAQLSTVVWNRKETDLMLISAWAFSLAQFVFFSALFPNVLPVSETLRCWLPSTSQPGLSPWWCCESLWLSPTGHRCRHCSPISGQVSALIMIRLVRKEQWKTDAEADTGPGRELEQKRVLDIPVRVGSTAFIAEVC